MGTVPAGDGTPRDGTPTGGPPDIGGASGAVPVAGGGTVTGAVATITPLVTNVAALTGILATGCPALFRSALRTSSTAMLNSRLRSPLVRHSSPMANGKPFRSER